MRIVPLQPVFRERWHQRPDSRYEASMAKTTASAIGTNR